MSLPKRINWSSGRASCSGVGRARCRASFRPGAPDRRHAGNIAGGSWCSAPIREVGHRIHRHPACCAASRRVDPCRVAVGPHTRGEVAAADRVGVRPVTSTRPIPTSGRRSKRHWPSAPPSRRRRRRAARHRLPRLGGGGALVDRTGRRSPEYSTVDHLLTEDAVLPTRAAHRPAGCRHRRIRRRTRHRR